LREAQGDPRKKKMKKMTGLKNFSDLPVDVILKITREFLAFEKSRYTVSYYPTSIDPDENDSHCFSFMDWFGYFPHMRLKDPQIFTFVIYEPPQTRISKSERARTPKNAKHILVPDWHQAYVNIITENVVDGHPFMITQSRYFDCKWFYLERRRVITDLNECKCEYTKINDRTIQVQLDGEFEFIKTNLPIFDDVKKDKAMEKGLNIIEQKWDHISSKIEGEWFRFWIHRFRGKDILRIHLGGEAPCFSILSYGVTGQRYIWVENDLDPDWM